MDTLSRCPYCGVRLGIPFIKAHVAQCEYRSDRSRSNSSTNNNNNNSNNKKKISVVSVRRKSRETTVEPPYSSEASPSVTTLMPQRSSGHMDSPATFRVDLRSISSEKPNGDNNNNNNNNTIMGNHWSYSDPKQPVWMRRSSSSLPSPPHDSRNRENEEQKKLDTLNSINMTSSEDPKDMWNKRGNLVEENTTGNNNNNNHNNNNNNNNKSSFTFDNDKLLERVSQLEMTNKELRESLLLEKEAREESEKKLKYFMELTQNELSTLRALVVGASKSAEAAHYGVQNVEKRLEVAATWEAVEELQQTLNSFLVTPNVPQSICGASSNTVEGPALTRLYVDNVSSVSDGHNKDELPHERKIYLSNQQQQQQPKEQEQKHRYQHQEQSILSNSPFLKKDTGEKIAELLNLKPTAVIRTNKYIPTLLNTSINSGRG